MLARESSYGAIIMDDITRAVHELFDEQEKSSPRVSRAAKIVGAQGNSAGGKERARKLSPAQRRRIALEGARARWRKRPTQTT